MFIQSKVAKSYSLGTTDADESWLLPTNPISHIAVTMRCLTAAANVVDTAMLLALQLLSVQVRFRGSQMWAVSGDDLMRMTACMGVYTPKLYNPAIADNSPRALTLVIPFGRKLLDPNECFPVTSKGELELYISWDAVTSSYDGITLDISTFELPDAKPKQFLRATTMSDTPTATGDKDYDLPRLAPLCGIGIFQTASYPTNATPTINAIKVLLNNLDTGYTDIDPVTMRALSPWGPAESVASDITTQLENAAASYTQNVLSTGLHTLTGADRDFMYLNYDPLMDGLHLLQGANANDVKLRVNFGATSAIRIIPVELFTPNLLPGRKG